MALRVLLHPPRFCAWRRVEQSRTDVRCLLQSRISRHAASDSSQNEWNLDLDMDREEAGHAPQSEPRPLPSACHTSSEEGHHKVTTRGNRLLFNIGKKLMTAEQFARKASVAKQRSPLTVDVDTTDFDVASDGGVCGEDVKCDIGDREEVEGGESDRSGKRWGGENEEEVEGGKSDWSGGRRGGESEGEREEAEGGEGRGGESDPLTSTGSRRRELYSIKETRKFLRGKGMAGSRLAIPNPEMTDLLQCLEEKLNPNTNHWDMFSTVPSVLGSTRGEVEGRIGDLRKIGFTRREVETVLLALPAILEVDYENVYVVCKILKKCIPGGHMLRGLLMRHPFLFLQPAKQIEARVLKLKELCRDPNALGFLLHNYPILLMAPLTSSTLQTITKYTTSPRQPVTEGDSCGMSHSWVSKALYHNLSTLPARMEPGPDVSALIDLLAEFQLDPTPTFIKFPGFFKATYSHVVSLLEVLTSSPLYLDTVAIRTVLSSVPDQLVWIEDVEGLRTHLQTLSLLFPSAKDCSEKVLMYPGLVLPQMKLDLWFESLTSLSFTRDQIVQLVSSCPNVLLQNMEEEFVPRLKLLLSVTDSSPSSLLSCPITSQRRMSATSLNVLKERLRYATKHKPDMISGQYLTEIFASEDKEFANFCGRTIGQLHSETGLVGIELKRFKSRQKAARSRKLPILETDHHSTESTSATPTDNSQEKVVDETFSKTPPIKIVKQSSRKLQKKSRKKISSLSQAEGSTSDSLSRPEKTSVSPKGVVEREKGLETKAITSDNGAMKEQKSRESITEDVLTSSLQPTYGTESLDKQKTSNTVITLTSAASHREKDYARKNHSRIQTKQTC